MELVNLEGDEFSFWLVLVSGDCFFSKKVLFWRCFARFVPCYKKKLKYTKYHNIIYIQGDSLSVKHSLSQKVFMFLKILFT